MLLINSYIANAFPEKLIFLPEKAEIIKNLI